MSNLFILDACALIALLNAEAGGEKVKTLLEDTENEIYMHLVTLCKIYNNVCIIRKKACV